MKKKSSIFIAFLGCLCACTCQENSNQAQEVCFAEIRKIDRYTPDQRGSQIRRSCAALFSHSACREALESLGPNPTEEASRAVISQCAATYCPHLEQPQPPLCSAEFNPGPWSHATWSSQWTRLIGAALASDNPQYPLYFWRGTASTMASDLFPSTPLDIWSSDRQTLRVTLRAENDDRLILSIGDDRNENTEQLVFQRDPFDTTLESWVDERERYLNEASLDIRSIGDIEQEIWTRVVSAFMTVGAHVEHP